MITENLLIYCIDKIKFIDLSVKFRLSNQALNLLPNSGGTSGVSGTAEARPVVIPYAKTRVFSSNSSALLYQTVIHHCTMLDVIIRECM